ncbi:TTL-domain-containing protein [Exidia glandulosa HHB12029]|uniref:TTL-domain-containing protein n=1 Tax=Exidia glandulosa HHB12029 TaxID=1314781 RepID=A0A165PIW2_EXIGL|nr:TTL-domain-containing protein [Exidia glandulosa HHB12029]
MPNPPQLTVVSYPTAAYTEQLAKGALVRVYGPTLTIGDTVPLPEGIDRATRLLQWTAYDDTRHELTLARLHTVLSSSYTIRKSLIRKHFLHRLVNVHVAKHPDALLKPGKGTPETWDLEISWADELDEMWSDDLYDLGQLLDENYEKDATDKRWFILKPGMADRGMGIRLFSSKDGLREIFESFEDDDEKEDEEDDTNVIANQLRHFVIQSYISDPLLVDPRVVSISGSLPPRMLEPRKFHLRAYCVASGALVLYLSPHILALFSSKPYSAPVGEDVDLSVHLTNTALQKDVTTHYDSVRLLSELPLPGGVTYTKILEQTRDLLAETFAAALGGGAAYFQPMPNAFELIGADLLVREDGSVVLLELNAEPAVHLTGERLGWTLQNMFEGIVRACVVPFFDDGGGGQAEAGEWKVGEEKHGLIKCLDVKVRAQGAW